MSRVLVIGCGGVASVAIQKCCQADEVFTELCIASRTKEKCDALARKLEGKTKTVITTAKVDADDVNQLIQLINSYKPDLVMNIALPYQDLTIMDACLACGVNYMDTANYEPEDTDDPEWRAIYEKRCKEAGFSAYFDYSWQWAYRKKFEEAMDDDFNTADAIAAIFELVKYANTTATAESSKEYLRGLLDRIVKLGDVLGLILDKKEELLDADIEKLIEERQAARKAKDFARADAIRDELLEKGIILKDTREGVQWKKA